MSSDTGQLFHRYKQQLHESSFDVVVDRGVKAMSAAQPPDNYIRSCGSSSAARGDNRVQIEPFCNTRPMRVQRHDFVLPISYQHTVAEETLGGDIGVARARRRWLSAFAVGEVSLLARPKAQRHVSVEDGHPLNDWERRCSGTAKDDFGNCDTRRPATPDVTRLGDGGLRRATRQTALGRNCRSLSQGHTQGLALTVYWPKWTSALGRDRACFT